MYYEEVVEKSVVGLEFTGIPADAVAYQHNLNIPFQVGQIWDVAGNVGSPWPSQEVKQADDGTIYIGDYPNVNSVPFYITANEIKCNSSWVNMYRITDVNIVCAYGKITDEVVHKIDPKYLPNDFVVEILIDETAEELKEEIKLVSGDFTTAKGKIKSGVPVTALARITLQYLDDNSVITDEGSFICYLGLTSMGEEEALFCFDPSPGHFIILPDNTIMLD